MAAKRLCGCIFFLIGSSTALRTPRQDDWRIPGARTVTHGPNTHTHTHVARWTTNPHCHSDLLLSFWNKLLYSPFLFLFLPTTKDNYSLPDGPYFPGSRHFVAIRSTWWKESKFDWNGWECKPKQMIRTERWLGRNTGGRRDRGHDQDATALRVFDCRADPEVFESAPPDPQHRRPHGELNRTKPQNPSPFFSFFIFFFLLSLFLFFFFFIFVFIFLTFPTHFFLHPAREKTARPSFFKKYYLYNSSSF